MVRWSGPKPFTGCRNGPRDALSSLRIAHWRGLFHHAPVAQGIERLRPGAEGRRFEICRGTRVIAGQAHFPAQAATVCYLRAILIPVGNHRQSRGRCVRIRSSVNAMRTAVMAPALSWHCSVLLLRYRDLVLSTAVR